MPRALKVAVQMDPIETVNIDADSTFALMLEAQRAGPFAVALRGAPHGAARGRARRARGARSGCSPAPARSACERVAAPITSSATWKNSI